MKKVRLITSDQHNGKEAISRTPLRNRYFFDGAWQEVELIPKHVTDKSGPYRYVMPEILRDAQIIETTEAIFHEMGYLFDIMALISHVECETPNRVHQATIQRQLCQLRQYGKVNYVVVDEQKGLYKKLSVVPKPVQNKIEFRPDWKKRFVEFLKEEGVYEAFVTALKSDANYEATKTIPQLINDVKKINGYNRLFGRAFVWDDTPEGQGYWEAVDNKWREVINGKN